MKPIYKIIFIFVLIALIGEAFLAQGKDVMDLPKFDFDIAVYPGVSPEKAKSNIFVWVRNSHVQFIKKDKTYAARYQLNISIYNKNGQAVFTKDKTYTTSEELYSSTIDPEVQRPHVFRHSVPPGDYLIKIRLYDMNTGKRRIQEQKKTVKLFDNNKLSVSDVLVLNSPEIDSIQLEKLIPPRRVPIQEKIFLYAEILSPENADTFDVEASLMTNRQIRIFNFSRSVKKSANRRKVLLEISKENMRQGRNLLTLKITTGSQSITVKKAIRFVTNELSFSYDSIDDMVGPLAYVSSADEWKKLRNVTGEELDNLFKQFWDKRDPNPGSPDNPLYEEFYKRVRVANKNFTKLKRSGWRTDRGRVYIIYGAPDRIGRNDQQLYSQAVFEIWYYDELRLEFVFEDRYGFGDYKLVSGNLNPRY